MAEEAPVVVAPAALEASAPEETVALYDGDELTPDTAGVVTRASLSRVVVLAGQSESGKTTLLATLYEKFCSGPFAGFRFAGSRTLWGLERRCHSWRVASGRVKGSSERTPLSQDQLMLHISLQRESDGSFVGLLITDLSGESFKAATEASEDCRALTMVRRADHFVLCLDGEKLLDGAARHQVITDGHSILRSFLEAKMLGLFSTVTVLFTKTDLHAGNKEMEDLRKDAIADYQRTFGESFGALHFSSSSAAKLEELAGVDDLLVRWTGESRLLSSRLVPTQPLDVQRREIEKFGRHMEN